MADNYIIGGLLGFLVARAEFWQYTNPAQPVMVFILVAFCAAWFKRVLEDDIRYLIRVLWDRVN